MNNPSLQEKISEKVFSEFKYEIDLGYVVQFMYDFIAERDEALRKEILSLPLYKNGSKAIPKGEIVVQLSAISSLLSKE